MRRTVAGLTLIAVLVGGAVYAADNKVDERPADLKKLGQIRVEAATAMCTALGERLDANEPLTPTFIDLLIRAHCSLAEAKAALAYDEAGRTAAWKEYRDYCQWLVDRMRAAGVQDISIAQRRQAEYAKADAEYRLASMTK